MTLFDFFQAEELPVPAITPTQAREIARTHFGVDADVTPLGSQQDANFLISGPGGEPIGVLKIANPAFSRIELEAQDAAASYISQTESGVRAATNLEPPGHPPIAELRADDGTVLYARIISYLSGGTMSGAQYVTPDRAAALGTLAGRTCRALAGFEHPGVDRILQWDLRYALRTVEVLAPHVTDTHRRDAVEAATAAAWRIVADLGDDLPIQVIHGDITDDNVVCSTLETGRMPDGIIDLGDLTRSWPVAELAVAVSSLLRHEGGEPAATLPAIAAFGAVRPLGPAEVEALWPLVVLRAAVLVVSGIHQASIDADNEYATGALDDEWGIFQRATAVPMEVMTAQIRHKLGVAHQAEPVVPETPLVAGLDRVARLDLSVESDAMDSGVWLNPDAEQSLATAALGDGASAVVTV
ncbi:MAG TPA: phosphotransferase, partial [Mycobacterium sp.]|nr:phosphotransferase [Mycobacterium sp.]